MPTKNPRLNVVLEPGLYEVLNKLAHNAGVSLSMMARDILKEALDEHEDLYWQKSAAVREKTFSYKKARSHKNIWK